MSLPDELLDSVTSFLDTSSLARLSCQSKFFKMVSNQDTLWMKHIHHEITQYPQLEKKETAKHFYIQACQLLNKIKSVKQQSQKNQQVINQLFADVVEQGYEKYIPLLIDSVDLTKAFAQYQPNNTYLHLAAIQGHTHLVDFLIKHNAKVNAIDCGLQTTIIHNHSIYSHLAWIAGRGTTPLARAVEKGHTQCAKLLIKAHANVDYQDIDSGDTALHHAARGGNTECVKLLLEKNADMTIKNSTKKIAYDVAISYQHKQCADLIAESMLKKGIELPKNNTCVIL